MIEVPQQGQKVTWRASLLYHARAEDLEQTFSGVKAHSDFSHALGYAKHFCLPRASRLALLPPCRMVGSACALGVIPLLREEFWLNLSASRCKVELRAGVCRVALPLWPAPLRIVLYHHLRIASEMER